MNYRHSLSCALRADEEHLDGERLVDPCGFERGVSCSLY